MTLPNRVTPAGALIAAATRGTMMGNRGVLHDSPGHLNGRLCTTSAWVTCLLAFRGRHRAPMPPGRYTALFFLDEATALAAGHRPCGECRNADYRRFKALWTAVQELPATTLIAEVEQLLHRERLRRGAQGITHRAALNRLPDGTMVLSADDDAPWLLWGDTMLRWTPAGYSQRRNRPRGGKSAVLTPSVTVRVLSAGYRPALHPSAGV